MVKSFLQDIVWAGCAVLQLAVALAVLFGPLKIDGEAVWAVNISIAMLCGFSFYYIMRESDVTN